MRNNLRTLPFIVGRFSSLFRPRLPAVNVDPVKPTNKNPTREGKHQNL